MANDLLFVLMAKGGPQSLYESWLLASLICFLLLKDKVFAISRDRSARIELHQSIVKLGKITRDVFRIIHL